MLPLIIVGRLSFPDGSARAWRKDAIQEAGEWPQVGPLFRGVPSGAHATVNDALDAAAALDGSPSFLELDTAGGELAGFFMPPVTERLHEDICVALRGAGKHGVTGWVGFVLVSEQVACLLRVGEKAAAGKQGKKSKKKAQESEADKPVEWMPSRAFFADEARAGAFVAVMDFTRRWEANQKLTRAEYVAQERSLGLLPLADQPTHARLMEVVKARVAEAHAALLAGPVKGGARDAPLAELYPDAASLAAALTAGDPPARAAAVELLARVDPAAAEPFALELLGDASRQTKRHAIRALGRMSTATSFDGLLGIDTVHLQREDAYGPGAVAAAVKEHRYDGAAKRTLALLDGKTFQPEAFAGLGRSTHAAARKGLAFRAGQELGFIAAHGGVACAPRLFALFDQHPAEEVRVAAGVALAGIGGPEIEKRAQELVMASHGMGRALNQDDERRRELLGITDEKDSGGIFKFHDLTSAGLDTLLAEGFIHPQARQNEAPSTSEFRQILQEIPEATVDGYAVSQARTDYRVHLEGIACDLSQVPEERHGAIREIFERLSQNGNEVELEGDDLRIWWT